MKASSANTISMLCCILQHAVFLRWVTSVTASDIVVDRLPREVNQALNLAPMSPGFTGFCGWNYECATAMHALLLDEYLNLKVLTSVDDSNGVKGSMKTFLKAATILPQPGARVNISTYGFTPGDRIGLFGALYYSYDDSTDDVSTRRKMDAIRANVEDRVLNWPRNKGVFARFFGWNSYVTDFFLRFIRPNSFLWIDDSFMGGYSLITTHPDVVCTMLVSYHNIFRDPEDGLWWHGLLVKRDGSVVNNGVKWARGNGWLLLATSALLLRTDEAYADRNTLTSLFLDQLQNLIQFQRTSGAFSNVVNDATSPDESSLVSVYIFSVGAAVHLSLLTASSDEAIAAAKAWNWLLQRTYANLTLSDTNAGQGLSLDPAKYNENVGQSDGPGVALVYYAIMGHRMLEIEPRRF